MKGSQASRHELHDFLRAARERVQPAELGLPARLNRRGTGLHQADMAAALNVSPRWYNGFENGTVTATNHELDRIAALLKLTQADRVHLYLLASGHEPPPHTIDLPEGTETVLARLVSEMKGLPVASAVTDIAWNLIAWNHTLSAWFPEVEDVPSDERNLMLWAFSERTEPIVAGIEEYRRAHLGWVHLALARYPGDPRLADLASRLQLHPVAGRMWSEHITALSAEIIAVRFHVDGVAEPVETDLVSSEHPGGYRLMMLVPRDGWPGQKPAGRRLARRRNRSVHEGGDPAGQAMTDQVERLPPSST